MSDVVLGWSVMAPLLALLLVCAWVQGSRPPYHCPGSLREYLRSDARRDILADLARFRAVLAELHLCRVRRVTVPHVLVAPVPPWGTAATLSKRGDQAQATAAAPPSAGGAASRPQSEPVAHAPHGWRSSNATGSDSSTSAPTVIGGWHGDGLLAGEPVTVATPVDTDVLFDEKRPPGTAGVDRSDPPPPEPSALPGVRRAAAPIRTAPGYVHRRGSSDLPASAPSGDRHGVTPAPSVVLQAGVTSDSTSTSATPDCLVAPSPPLRTCAAVDPPRQQGGQASRAVSGASSTLDVAPVAVQSQQVPAPDAAGTCWDTSTSAPSGGRYPIPEQPAQLDRPQWDGVLTSAVREWTCTGRPLDTTTSGVSVQHVTLSGLVEHPATGLHPSPSISRTGQGDVPAPTESGNGRHTALPEQRTARGASLSAWSGQGGPKHTVGTHVVTVPRVSTVVHERGQE